MRACLIIGVWCCVAIPTVAGAQSDGEPLREGGFNVDLVTGPVLGTGQITGLGGAFTALAQGIDGAAWNPAAYAARTLWGVAWFDWDLSLSVSPGTVGDVDFDNNGRQDAWRSDATSSGNGDQRFQYAAVGMGLQLGRFGMGALLRAETYRIDLPGDEGSTEVSLVTGHYGVAHAFLDGQLVVGAGLRSAGLTITAPQGDVMAGTQQQSQLVSFLGANLEAGMLLRFNGAPWRVGVTTRMPVVSELPQRDGGVQPVNGVSALPNEVRLPWEVQLGLAWQIGARPLNRRWDNPHDTRDGLREAMLERRRQRAQAQWQLEQREARAAQLNQLQVATEPPRDQTAVGVPVTPGWWAQERVRRVDEERELYQQTRAAERRRELEVRSLSRSYLLLSGEVILVGATANGVGVESFLNGVRQTSGDRISAGFRAGAELEPIAHWLKLRGGGYLEPSRYPGRPYRAHGTAGFDVRLFTWDLFGLVEPFTLRTGATLDVAVRYTSFGISLGIWH